MTLHKSSTEKWEQHKEEKKEEEKLHQRAVWSLTFFVFGVHLVKAEVQEDPAREVHPDRQDGLLEMRKGMIWENSCRKPKRNKNSQGKDPRTSEENRQGREGSQASWKGTARVRTQEP